RCHPAPSGRVRRTAALAGRIVSSGGTLVLIRHGQSAGNADGVFTGLLDVPLTRRGRDEAIAAAAQLNDAAITLGTLICSPLLRAQQTAELLEGQLDPHPGNRITDWQLAERNYGRLTGHRKDEIAQRYGQAQFQSWRRSMDDAPPPMSRATASRLFRGRGDGITEAHLGRTEALRDAVARVSECLRELITPRLELGQVVAVVAHGNSLRALCAILDHLSDDEVMALNLPTGQPLIYQLDSEGHPLQRGGEYLDPAVATAAAALIASEGGT
ncbi:MAG: 2,3-bisphosphoglycerate-dependent phosphoglycerate mutase, partial [Pseudolysinimonas sp.]